MIETTKRVALGLARTVLVIAAAIFIVPAGPVLVTAVLKALIEQESER